MRRSIALSGWLLGSVLGAFAAFAEDVKLVEGPDPLASAQWTKRLLAICTVEDAFLSNPFLDAQADEAATDLPGYIDRDLILVWITDDKVMSLEPRRGETGALEVAMSESKSDTNELRRQTGCQPARDFVALIGKDGGVKLRSEEKVSNEALFALIDSMPMRQREMRLKD